MCSYTFILSYERKVSAFIATGFPDHRVDFWPPCWCTTRELKHARFETQTATGSELFSLLTCLYTTTFTLLSIFSPLEMISVKSGRHHCPDTQKCSLPGAVRVSKTRVLKLPSNCYAPTWQLHTKLYKVAWNALTNNSEMMYGTDLRIGEVIYEFVSYNIPVFGLLHWTVSILFFCLRDSENDLFRTLPTHTQKI